jgi:hypothetical protein
MLDAAKQIGDSKHRADERRISYAKDRLGPVEEFYRQSFQHCARLEAILSIGGADGQMTAYMAQKAFRAANEMISALSGLGVNAQEAAQLVHPKLRAAIDDAETIGAQLCAQMHLYPVGGSVRPILDRLRHAQRANDRVAELIRAQLT